MQGSPTKLFTDRFNGWVAAYNEKHGKEMDASRLREDLLKVLPRHVPARLGMGLQDGVLTSSSGYRFGPKGDEGSVIEKDSARACGERYLQLAEYYALCAMARTHESLEVKLEDNLMDLTCRLDGRLLAYVEAKVRSTDARRLIDGLRSLDGPVPDATRSSPDHIKKANYILKAEPAEEIAFAVRAGHEDGSIFDECYRVTVTGRQLSFTPTDVPIALQVELPLLKDPRHRAQACLVWWLERKAGSVLRRGKHGRYLVYREVGDRVLVVVGTERSGAIYTVLDSLLPDERRQFESVLREHDISLGELEGLSRGWKRGGRLLILDDEREARELGIKIGTLLASFESHETSSTTSGA